MWAGSITFKLLSIIVGALLLTTFSILFLADLQLTQIIDKSQDAVYAEKVDAIWGTLNRSNERLKKTGLVEAYRKDFQESTLKNLRQTYYKGDNQTIYPLIIDTHGMVVMHPVLPPGDPSLKQTEIIKKMLASETGEFDYVYLGQKKWCSFKRFPGWNWVIAYTIPLDIKYSDARKFRNILVYIMVGSTIAVLLLLSVTVAKITKPIIKLTDISSQIADGNLDQQIDITGTDEVGTLARSFVHMRDAIRKQIAELNSEISERKLAEEELRKAQNYIANIIDSMPSVLVGVDRDGTVTQWNQEAERTTGLSPKEAVGQPLEKAFPPLTSEMERVHRAIETRKRQTDHKRSRQANHETIYEDMTVYPLVANGVEGAVIRLDDITEKVRLEEMMVQSEKMLSVGGLAAGMAHEINNPLAGMMQTAGVMSDRLSNLEMGANLRAAEEVGIDMDGIKAFMEKRGILRMITAINESGHRVAEIVNNMLSFARKSDSAVSSHDMAELLDKTLELAATDYDLKRQYDFKTIEIEKEYEENLPQIPCERAKIQQVLLNILRNGAQAMQKTSGLDGANKPCFTLRLLIEKKANMFRVEIKDNGPGMDEVTRRRIFEPFFTTKPVGEGTGLGLSVSYFIITENHGGTMDVTSTPGQGTTFIIRLPLVRQEGQQ